MRVLAFLFALFTTATLFGKSPKASQPLQEYIQVQIPHDEAGKWKQDLQKTDQNGRFYTVWSKVNEHHELERIVIVSSPYKSSEIPSIEKAIGSATLPVKLQIGSYEVLQKSTHEALLKWNTALDKTSLCKLFLGTQALHSVSYIYKGKKLNKIEQNKWLSFLKRAELNSLQNQVEEIASLE